MRTQFPRLGVRQSGKALRSGSLFTQPSVTFMPRRSVSSEAPVNMLDSSETPPLRYEHGKLYARNDLYWAAVDMSAAQSPYMLRDPAPASRSTRTAPGDKDAIQWDVDADFFYLSPLGRTDWLRVPLSAAGVVPADLRSIPAIGGGTISGTTGGLMYAEVTDLPTTPQDLLLTDAENPAPLQTENGELLEWD